MSQVGYWWGVRHCNVGLQPSVKFFELAELDCDWIWSCQARKKCILSSARKLQSAFPRLRWVSRWVGGGGDAHPSLSPICRVSTSAPPRGAPPPQAPPGVVGKPNEEGRAQCAHCTCQSTNQGPMEFRADKMRIWFVTICQQIYLGYTWDILGIYLGTTWWQYVNRYTWDILGDHVVTICQQRYLGYTWGTTWWQYVSRCGTINFKAKSQSESEEEVREDESWLGWNRSFWWNNREGRGAHRCTIFLWFGLWHEMIDT